MFPSKAWATHISPFVESFAHVGLPPLGQEKEAGARRLGWQDGQADRAVRAFAVSGVSGL